MNKVERDLVEEVARWLENAGYRGDLSALTACLHDVGDSLQDINGNILPLLLKMDYSQREEALEVLVRLWLELEHIQRHAKEGVENLTKVRDYFDTSPNSGSEVRNHNTP